MRIRVSDYIEERLADFGVTDIFTVTGGGAMYLNDSFGHSKRLRCLYQHHEQACAMAAEAYARLENRPAAVCVTSGPGAVNAMSGILGAWMESIPVIVLSGQVRTGVTVRGTHLPLRSMGVQEFDITKACASMTKYAVMAERAEDIRFELEKALFLCMHGRRGPVWLDLPLDVQSAEIDPEELMGYVPEADPEAVRIPVISEETVSIILDKLFSAHRPLLFGGFGVRAAGASEEFRCLVRILNIPATAGASSVDLIPFDDPHFIGISGLAAGRAGNLALQNSDVYLSIGSRQSLLQTGYSAKGWARESYTILNDLDENELKKPNLHVSLPVPGDAGELIRMLLAELKRRGVTEMKPLCRDSEWLDHCRNLKQKYPAVTDEEKGPQKDGKANLYAFYDALSEALPEGEILVAGCGTARVAGTQAFRVKEGQRFLTNSATASMGYGLPAAIGACISSGGKCVTLVTGDGSLMMNLQELQTISGNALPIRIFVIENDGYHSIRQTQKSFFGGTPVGIGPDSADLSFPETAKLAAAFGLRYTACLSDATIKQDVENALKVKTPCLISVRVTTRQGTEPKLSARRCDDGTMVSPPLEDLSPFLSRDELREDMRIPLTEEEEQR